MLSARSGRPLLTPWHAVYNAQVSALTWPQNWVRSEVMPTYLHNKRVILRAQVGGRFTSDRNLMGMDGVWPQELCAHCKI